MALTLDALAVLDAIERHGSFARAARALDRVPSALTYTVRKLEGDLDVLIFDRRSHRAQLTAAGRDLLVQGRQLIAAAAVTEARVRRIARGWEPELRIVVDDLVEATRLHPVFAEFYREHGAASGGTALRVMRGVLAGTWEALADGEADLAIGVAADTVSGSGFAARALTQVRFVFAVAPDHPLASTPEPLPAELVQLHRAVAVGDTAQTLARRSTGLLTGQDVLTVPTLAAKIAAQVAGLGCGYLPDYAARAEIRRGRLIEKAVEASRPVTVASYAWRAQGAGRALKWFVRRLDDPRLRKALFADWA